MQENFDNECIWENTINVYNFMNLIIKTFVVICFTDKSKNTENFMKSCQ